MPRPFQDELVDVIPHLQAFARMLCRDEDRAKDLTQDAVLRALKAQDRFQMGTNFKAWMFTILRNIFYDQLRQRRFEMEPIDDRALSQSTPATQEVKLHVRDFDRAFQTLSADQREVLILVGASGFSYEDAAEICGCAVGTIKSRVSRARAELGQVMEARERPAAQRHQAA